MQTRTIAANLPHTTLPLMPIRVSPNDTPHQWGVAAYPESCSNTPSPKDTSNEESWETTSNASPSMFANCSDLLTPSSGGSTTPTAAINSDSPVFPRAGQQDDFIPVIDQAERRSSTLNNYDRFDLNCFVDGHSSASSGPNGLRQTGSLGPDRPRSLLSFFDLGGDVRSSTSSRYNAADYPNLCGWSVNAAPGPQGLTDWHTSETWINQVDHAYSASQATATNISSTDDGIQYPNAAAFRDDTHGVVPYNTLVGAIGDGSQFDDHQMDVWSAGPNALSQDGHTGVSFDNPNVHYPNPDTYNQASSQIQSSSNVDTGGIASTHQRKKSPKRGTKSGNGIKKNWRRDGQAQRILHCVVLDCGSGLRRHDNIRNHYLECHSEGTYRCYDDGCRGYVCIPRQGSQLPIGVKTLRLCNEEINSAPKQCSSTKEHRNHVCRIPGCGKSFPTPKALADHMRICHPGQ